MEGYKELLDKLNGLVKLLESGELSLEELSTLEEVTRKLHERSIILRYKAFETSVLGETVAAVEEIVEEAEPVAEPEPTPEPVEEEPEEEETAFDFAIFNEESAEEEASDIPVMDFSSPEEEAPMEEEIALEPVAEVVEEPIEEEPEVISEPEVEETPEPIVSEDPVTEKEPTEEVSEPAPQPTSTGSSFLDRFSQQDNSLGGRFSAAPLPSLIGAFGLNERLRFINDLFDGSSEQFSDAIKALDSQSGLESALQKAAGYADENEWEPEEEVVAEFMTYLKRRYA